MDAQRSYVEDEPVISTVVPYFFVCERKLEEGVLQEDDGQYRDGELIHLKILLYTTTT